MQPEQQQRIMGYFIEEAKDHLNTIEQGLLNLQRTLNDAEIVNEMFRAAHSVKGGAAMLGLISIQHVGHRLEDFFKVMSETPIQADQRLETLLLRVFDALQALVEQLQGPFGLTEDSATRILSDVEPLFGELEQHLESLKQASILPLAANAIAAKVDLDLAIAPATEESLFANPFEPAWKTIFRSEVPGHLRNMLELFKGAETSNAREQLQQSCDQLIALGADNQLINWQHLIIVSRQAIGSPNNTFRNLAPVVIREIKQAHDLVLSDQIAEVTPSSTLVDLAAIPPAVTMPDSLADVLSVADLTEPIDLTTDAPIELISEPLFGEMPDSPDSLDDLFGDFSEESIAEHQGPEVGMAELNSLADLFESGLPDLGEVWQDEEIVVNSDAAQEAAPNISLSEENYNFSDLLLDMNDSTASTGGVDATEDELSALFGNSLAEEDQPIPQDQDFETVIQAFEPSLGRSSDAVSLDLDDFFNDLELADVNQLSDIPVTSESRQNPSLDDLSNLFAGVDDLDLISEPADLSVLTDFSIASSEPAKAPDPLPDPWAELDQPEIEAEQADLEGSRLSLADMDFSDFLAEEDTPFDQLLNEEALSSELLGEQSSLDQLDFNNLLDSSEPSPLVESLDALTQSLSIEPAIDLESDIWGLPDQAPEELFANPEVLESLMAEALEIAQESDSVDLDQESVLPDSISDLWGELGSSPTVPDESHFNEIAANLPPEELLANPEVMESLLAEALEMAREAGDIYLEEVNRFDQAQTEDLSDRLAEMLERTDTPAVWLEETVIQIYESELPLATEPAILSETEFVLATNLEDPDAAIELLDDFLDLNPLSISDSLFLSETEYVLEVNLQNPTISFEVFDSLLEVNPIAEIEAIVYYADLDLSNEQIEEVLPAQTLEFLLENQDLDLVQLVEGSPDFLADTLTEDVAERIWSQAESESTIAGFVMEQDLLDQLVEESAPFTAESLFGSDLAEADLFSEESFSINVGSDLNADSDLDDAFDALSTPASEIASADPLDFADLDTLLSGDFELVPPAPSEPALSQPAVSSPESDFDELDALLKEAEETLGGSPTVKGARTLGSQLRRPVRQGRAFGEQTMRVPVKHLDSLSNLVGELVVNRNSLEQDQERLRQSLDNLLYQVQQLGDVGQRMQDLYERSLLETSLLARRTEDVSNTAGVEYDPLEMDRFTGFHSLSQEMIELIVRVRESASDIEFVVDETEQVTRTFRQVTTQLQEGLNRSRMVPFAQIADRLPRAVRDISLKMGKQAELVVEGRDTLIDKMILEQLYDPMTHLVNNAITHGIESPALRGGAGKSPAGRILVRAFHQGNQTVISVSDDGSGIDINRVKEKAIEKRLITPAEARNMTRLDIYDLLFHPGFTTKDQADDFSGRGVGMDVVRTYLNEIRGTITTDSSPGKGTTFTIRLPLTLSISKALCCISDRARIAFPMDGVEDMLDVPKERIQTDAEGHSSFTWRDTLLPIQPLSALLTYNRHLSRGNVYGGAQDENVASIVVLRSAGNYLALQVDQVLGEQEIVIKQLEGPVPKPIGIAGATVLGDGRIMPIADVLELIDLSMGRIRRDAGSSLWAQGDDLREPDALAVKTEPTVLIVDDSITVRELLSMTFSKIGYRVEQARDGQEAWEKLRSGMPCDIVFCDIEMPRMDGLELLSRIQKDSHLNHIPIAMLTSRGADRHRQMAVSLGAKGYFTKPYLEEALLDAAQRMLKGEMLINQA